MAEGNCGRFERREIRVRTTSGPSACFPFAAQCAELKRWRTAGQKAPEIVYLLTSFPSAELSAERCLQLKRAYWSIENGAHQRLDGAAQEDKSRVRLARHAWTLGLFRRWSISLARAWINQQPNPRLATTQGFFDAMRQNRCRRAFLIVHSVLPRIYDG